MLTADQNFRLLEEIEANRQFLLMAFQQNPKLLEGAEARIKQIFETLPRSVREESKPAAGMNKQRGISLIELVMFIVIISIALIGIMQVMNITSRASADPLVHKQALAIAESLLEEIELMPFTICDPDDPNAVSALFATDCTGGAGGVNDESTLPLGPETAASVGGAEGRNGTTRYDNVSDYNGFSMSGATILDIVGNPIVGLTGYTVSALIGTGGCAGIPSPNALTITVTATGPDNVPITLDGCRTRYTPKA